MHRHPAARVRPRCQRTLIEIGKPRRSGETGKAMKNAGNRESVPALGQIHGRGSESSPNKPNQSDFDGFADPASGSRSNSIQLDPTRSNPIKVILSVLMAEGLAVGPTGSSRVKADQSDQSDFVGLKGRGLRGGSGRVKPKQSDLPKPETGDRKGNEEPRLGPAVAGSTAQWGQTGDRKEVCIGLRRGESNRIKAIWRFLASRLR
jgi:hypothetical protein